MRLFFITSIIVSALFISCKQDTSEKELPENSMESPISKTIATDTISEKPVDRDLKKLEGISIKQNELKTKPDEREALETLVIEKKLTKEDDLFTLKFTYPLLNEKINPAYRNFNQYITEQYVDVVGTEASILEDAELICDSIRANRFHEVRTIDYKIYNLNDKHISILFYKENFYARTLHPSLSFTCLNYDLNNATFLKYEDIFTTGSEETLRAILNDEITRQIAAGDLYYDCWELSSEDFFQYKNNFVLHDTYAEFYFDDCIVCPSYTGTYSVHVSLEKLLPVLRNYSNSPFKG